MTKPIQIRREDVVRDIRELAALTGKGITQVVGEAVRRELERIRRVEAQRREVDLILARVAALPRTGRSLSDDDLYDENGLPK